jgi:hypothetical protein
VAWIFRKKPRKNGYMLRNTETTANRGHDEDIQPQPTEITWLILLVSVLRHRSFKVGPMRQPFVGGRSTNRL